MADRVRGDTMNTDDFDGCQQPMVDNSVVYGVLGDAMDGQLEDGLIERADGQDGSIEMADGYDGHQDGLGVILGWSQWPQVLPFQAQVQWQKWQYYLRVPYWPIEYPGIGEHLVMSPPVHIYHSYCVQYLPGSQKRSYHRYSPYYYNQAGTPCGILVSDLEVVH